MKQKKMPLQRLLGLTFLIAGILFGIVAFINHEDPAIYLPVSLVSIAIGAAALLLQKKN